MIESKKKQKNQVSCKDVSTMLPASSTVSTSKHVSDTAKLQPVAGYCNDFIIAEN